MWRRLSAWYQAWNDELLAIMLNPELAQQVQGCLNQKVAQRLAQLTTIERQQLHQFCSTYQGWRLWRALLINAVIFSVIGLLMVYWKPKLGIVLSVAIANTIGFGLLASITGIWFNYRQIAEKKYKLLLWTNFSLFGGAFVGFAIGATVRNKPVLPLLQEHAPTILLVCVVISVLYGLLLLLVSAWRNMGYERIATQMQWEAEREKVARELSESQLRLLRAQIEPHFLFNTLGAVQQLAEQGTKGPHGESRAAELTANLIVFLRASMSEMRAEQITLEEEFAMVKAYLEVMQVRMAHRLTFSLDLPIQFVGYKIPSMVLLTLAENAIKHGLEPSIRGGSIHISAEALGSDLCITVQDTGVGLSDKPSNGIGLQNIRDRLRLAYSDKARLDISEAAAGGVIAEISLPLVQSATN